MHDLSGYPEARLLKERPDDREDSRLLFEAAQKTGLLITVPGATLRFAPARLAPHLEVLFAVNIVEAAWKPAEFFHQRIKEREFVSFLQNAFPGITNLEVNVARLALGEDPQATASMLVNLGILDTGAGARRFRVRLDPVPAGTPTQLLCRRQGPMRGLSPEEFIAELHNDGARGFDDLYNALFWQVADALDLGNISAADVPPFLRDFVAAL